MIANGKKRSMITDGSFRRTAKCNHFAKMLQEKEQNMKTFPAKSLKGKEFNQSWMELDGLKEPVMIMESPSTLGMKLPDSNMTLMDVAGIIGTDFPVKVIGVGEQTEITGWSVGDYAHYLANRTQDHKVLNMIPLEFSMTPLYAKVQSPNLVRDIDWIDKCWPLQVNKCRAVS
jgi:F-box and leucine-rich repeat protein 10/11